MNDILKTVFLNNSVAEYITAAGIFAGGTIIILIVKRIISGRIVKQAGSEPIEPAEQALKKTVKTLFPFFLFLVFYLAVKTLKLSDSFSRGFGTASIIIFTFLIVRTLISSIQALLLNYIKGSENSEKMGIQFKAVRVLLNLVVWAIALVFLLDNIGVKISAVVAGLGIGGIAVALAAQTILGDLFGYFVILFDKPFEIGDFIIVNDKMGC